MSANETGRIEGNEAQLADQVRKALLDNRLTLAYESIASLDGSSRAHRDVLLRLQGEDGRELRAGEFMPAARKFKLMRALDRWVVAQAIATLAERKAGKPGSSLFVKLSEDTLCDAGNFLPWLSGLIQSRGVALRPGEIVFQFQEIAVQNHLAEAKSLYRELGAVGAGLAVEHFGVSGRSMLLLDELPVAYIRFHPSLNDTPTSSASAAVDEPQKKLSALVELARHKGIKTIIPHVEDPSTMARLWQMGVNFVQGFHVQKLEAEESTVRLH